MAEPGRRPKLTPDVHGKLIQALQMGHYRQDAADYAGIGASTLRRWLAQGRKDQEGPYAELYDAVREAESRAKLLALGAVTKAAHKGDWRAAAWYLQRKYPHQFSEQSQLFLVAKAFEQLEAAAEATGRPLPESVWDDAWTRLAQEFAGKVPGLSGASLDPAQDDGLGPVDLSEDDRKVLLKVVRAAKKGRPGQALPFGRAPEGESDPASSEEAPS